jgi:hypothetical protein
MLTRRGLGDAGVFYVAAQLQRRGLITAFAPPNAPTVDMAIWTPDQQIVNLVQVKTRQQRTGWRITRKNEDHAPTLF